MRKKYSSLNHSRVDIYKVTHNPKYHNFLISPRLLFEKTLNFVYTEDGHSHKKTVPLSVIGPHLKKKMFFHTDEQTLMRQYKGEAYYIDENIIFN